MTYRISSAEHMSGNAQSGQGLSAGGITTMRLADIVVVNCAPEEYYASADAWYKSDGKSPRQDGIHTALLKNPISGRDITALFEDFFAQGDTHEISVPSLGVNGVLRVKAFDKNVVGKSPKQRAELYNRIASRIHGDSIFLPHFELKYTTRGCSVMSATLRFALKEGTFVNYQAVINRRARKFLNLEGFPPDKKTIKAIAHYDGWQRPTSTET
jgi:hypothetical protein